MPNSTVYSSYEIFCRPFPGDEPIASRFCARDYVLFDPGYGESHNLCIWKGLTKREARFETAWPRDI
ncbi:MAG TPA: hypothetical protein VNZ53_22110, partial [Steroidobacteraceae bacterium]|nr:hypothetical protein [Steroidobacteraceae bacterium]